MTHRQRQARRRRHKARPRNWLLLGLAVVLAVGIIGGLSVVGYVLAVASSAPNIDELKPIDKGSSSARSTRPTATCSATSSPTRSARRSPGARCPNVLRNATVAIEDQRFYHHGGVDYEWIVRAALATSTPARSCQGGSTITQQLVRNLYIRSPKRDLKRKIREAKLASELEQQHSKQWILEQYLNDVPYGTVDGAAAVGVRGRVRDLLLQAASELSLTEAALLAGPAAGAVRLQPVPQPGRPRSRAATRCCRRWPELGYITREQAAEAQQRAARPASRQPLHEAPRALLLRLRAGRS